MNRQPKHNARLLELDTSLLHPHPNNPRIAPREGVITAIVANLGDEYPQKHALHVRPHGDGYQVISGHHRLEAATRKGLAKVWCWVEDLDDEAAFMELALSNLQRELSPLEFGIHAFKAVPKAEGGRGKKGGLSEYAEKIGKTVQYVSQIRQAAEVVSRTKERNPQVDLKVFHDKTQHLAVLHRLPEDRWPEAVEWLAQHDVGLSTVQLHVRQELKRMQPGVADSDFRESVQATYGPDIVAETVKSHIDGLKQLVPMMTVEERDAVVKEVAKGTGLEERILLLNEPLTKEGIELIHRSILALKPKDRDEVLEELEQGSGAALRREVKRYALLRAASMIAQSPRGQGRAGRSGRVAKGVRRVAALRSSSSFTRTPAKMIALWRRLSTITFTPIRRLRKYALEERVKAADQFLSAVNALMYERS